MVTCTYTPLIALVTTTVANEILTVAKDADEATATFVSLLDETFTNESYLTTVLEGGMSETFDSKISDSQQNAIYCIVEY